MPPDELTELLDSLDDDTRQRWEVFLEQVEAEVQQNGPRAAQEHLEAALRHLLAVGWTLHRCYGKAEARHVMTPLREAASVVENAREALLEVPKKPLWSQ